jgi:hypothetical protein
MTPAAASRMPYPGLRSFRREESDLFFGREDCINTMIDRLAATRFLAVLGSSGTGKSSLVKTGLLDALDLGLMASAGSSWRVVDFRPGSTPLRNLAQRLIETENGAAEPGANEAAVDMLRAFLARGPRALAEWCAEQDLPPDANLLLLVDQFEELFRYQDYAGREEAEAFAAMLTESARAEGLPVYVALTMRSEYLGACALIENLAEAISAGIFLTPRMSREQCRSAIVGPATVCGVAIEPALVNRLLNDLSAFAPWEDRTSRDQLDRLARRADQLPLLQYCLNLMWMRARSEGSDGPATLTLAEYERIGGLGGALDAHANMIFDRLAPPLKPVAERVFRSLTEGSTVTDAVRRPTSLADLIAICGGDEAAVRAVVDTFRAPGCNFLTPEADPKHAKPLDPETFIDISHESLVRQWRILSEWLERETRAARQWRRLKDRFDDRDLMSQTEIAQTRFWCNQERPTAAWARRYGGDFRAVMRYLDECDQRHRRLAPLVLPLVAIPVGLTTVVAMLVGLYVTVGPVLSPPLNTFATDALAVITNGITCGFALWHYTRVGFGRATLAALAMIAPALAVGAARIWLLGQLSDLPLWYSAFIAVSTFAVLAVFEPRFRKLRPWLLMGAVLGASVALAELFTAVVRPNAQATTITNMVEAAGVWIIWFGGIGYLLRTGVGEVKFLAFLRRRRRTSANLKAALES